MVHSGLVRFGGGSCLEMNSSSLYSRLFRWHSVALGMPSPIWIFILSDGFPFSLSLSLLAMSSLLRLLMYGFRAKYSLCSFCFSLSS